MSSRTSLRLKVTILLGVLVAMTALALGAAEYAIRHRERHRSTVPGTMPTLFYPHYRLRHSLVRNADYYGWITVNAQGFRGRPVALAKGDVDVRIMVVGASTTFDSFVEGGDDAAWPARLEHWLSTMDTSTTFEVINAGVPGYRVLDNLIRLQMELFAYAPDVLVLYHAHNDLFAGLRGGVESGPPVGDRPGEIGAQTPWTRWLGQHSLLYSKVMARIGALRFRARRVPEPCTEDCGTPEGNLGDEVLDRAAQAFERDVRSFVLLAHSFGVRVILLEPHHISGPGATAEPNGEIRAMWQQAIGLPAERVFAGYVRFAEVLEKVADQTDAVYVSTRTFGITGPAVYYDGDPIHFNSAGADRMGRLVAEQFVDVLAELN